MSRHTLARLGALLISALAGALLVSVYTTAAGSLPAGFADLGGTARCPGVTAAHEGDGFRVEMPITVAVDDSTYAIADHGAGCEVGQQVRLRGYVADERGKVLARGRMACGPAAGEAMPHDESGLAGGGPRADDIWEVDIPSGESGPAELTCFLAVAHADAPNWTVGVKVVG